MTRPPIVGGPVWSAVTAREGGTCGCRGECGRRHKDTGGRCTRHDGLIVGPRDLSVSLAVAVALDPAGLTTWCERCHGPARSAAKAAAGSARAAESATEALF
ncbi:hypothetical protein ACIRL2_23750 [Embleya sp. NPDC127516]|uniref:hypothetical protein n=1 Tax=Embleya sp. NPDC127516 TaxID=3363990 RepID=UPI0037F259AB